MYIYDQDFGGPLKHTQKLFKISISNSIFRSVRFLKEIYLLKYAQIHTYIYICFTGPYLAVTVIFLLHKRLIATHSHIHICINSQCKNKIATLCNIFKFLDLNLWQLLQLKQSNCW